MKEFELECGIYIPMAIQNPLQLVDHPGLIDIEIKHIPRIINRRKSFEVSDEINQCYDADHFEVEKYFEPA